jgi:FtsZ-binding cell division protein ZapB
MTDWSTVGPQILREELVEAARHLAPYNKIAAIRAYRAATNAPLIEAKPWIEDVIHDFEKHHAKEQAEHFQSTDSYDQGRVVDRLNDHAVWFGELEVRLGKLEEANKHAANLFIEFMNGFDKIETFIDATEERFDNVEEKAQDALDTCSSLQGQITDLNDQVNDLESDVRDHNTSLDDLENKISDLEDTKV